MHGMAVSPESNVFDGEGKYDSRPTREREIDSARMCKRKEKRERETNTSTARESVRLDQPS